MFTGSIEELQGAVLENIIDELNVKNHVPVSFDCVTLTRVSEGIYHGAVHCSEAGGHLWELQLRVAVNRPEVTWELDGLPKSESSRRFLL
jgi:hypothetical protein